MKLAQGDRSPVQLTATQSLSAVRGWALPGPRRLERVAVSEVLIPVVTLAWLALGVIARFPAGAAQVETAATSPASILTADLNYQETDEVLVSRQCDVKPQTAGFTKEPPLGKKNVLRGFLLGGEQPDRATAYVWIGGMAGCIWT